MGTCEKLPRLFGWRMDDGVDRGFDVPVARPVGEMCGQGCRSMEDPTTSLHVTRKLESAPFRKQALLDCLASFLWPTLCRGLQNAVGNGRSRGECRPPRRPFVSS